MNGHALGYVPGSGNEDNYSKADGEDGLWMRRSADIPPSLIVPGANRVQLTMRSGVNKITGSGTKGGYVDRLEVEIGYVAR